MKGPFLLGVDAGTLYVKSVLFNIHGKELATAGKEISVEYPAPGWAEQDMNLIWKATAETIRAVLRESRVSPADIAAVAATGQGQGSFLITKTGRPARRKAIMWLDSRKDDIMSEWYEGWKDHGVASEIYDVSGWRLIFSMQILHMAWLVRNEPETIRETFAHLECKDWIRFRLTGEAYMDTTAASTTGLYNTARRCWEDALFEKLGIPREKFPDTLESWQKAGEVTPAAARETGLRQGTPVAAGSVDICSSSLGAGAVHPGMSCSIIGTAGIHQLCVDSPLYDKNRQYSVACAAAPSRWNLFANAVTAGSCLRWFRDELGFKETVEAKRKRRRAYALYDDCVSKVPLGSRGILFHPFFSGERSPFVEPNARGLFFGLGLWTKKEDLVRSIYEGVAFATKDNFRLFEEAGIRPKSIRLVGGGARSEVWAQMIADVTGYEVEIPEGEEFGAKGCAQVAGVVAGLYEDPFQAVERTTNIVRRFEPNPINQAKYSKLVEIYRKLYERLWGFYDEYSDVLREVSAPRER
jgi:sugar (pentulose or hexulose) kinase